MTKRKKAQVVLEFKSQKAKAYFIGGLIDGWGEGGPFTIEWNSGGRLRDGSCSIPATRADVIKVLVFDDHL